MSRRFEVRQEETCYKTVFWRVEADSFEEAEQLIRDGYGEFWDSEEYDSDYGEITDVTCRECGDSGDRCECERVDHEFMAEIGL